MKIKQLKPYFTQLREAANSLEDIWDATGDDDNGDPITDESLLSEDEQEDVDRYIQQVSEMVDRYKEFRRLADEVHI
jgi:hypothetical protein